MKDENSKAILARLALAAGVTTHGALSGVLGVSSQAVYDAKKKDKIPDSWIRVVAEQTGASADWLFFGRGQMLPDNPVQAAAIKCDPPATLPEATRCTRCEKLDSKIDELETERRAICTENRQWATKMEQLLRENGALRERCATLEERQKNLDPAGYFSKQTLASSSKVQLGE